MAEHNAYYGEYQGTVFPCDPFDPEAAAAKLRKAMKGFGTDEKAIIEVMSTHTSDQLGEIILSYKQQYGKDLIKDLKSEISGNFKRLVLALLEDHVVYDIKEIHNAIKGLGTDEKTILEILLTCDNNEIEVLKEEYKKQFHSDLEKDLMSDTSGHFRRLLVSVLTAFRDESEEVNEDLAIKEAQELYKAGAGKVGTDESTFNRIFCTRNELQLMATFNAYQAIYGKDIEKVIKKEFSGAIQDGFVAIVRIVRNTPAYFAERFYKSMHGIGTKDNDLIRLVVTRRELDMEQIKYEFMKKYGKPLESYIKDDTSGDYKKLLLAICKETDMTAVMRMKQMLISPEKIQIYIPEKQKKSGHKKAKGKKTKVKMKIKVKRESGDEEDGEEEQEEDGSGSSESGQEEGEEEEEEEKEEEDKEEEEEEEAEEEEEEEDDD